MAYFPPDSEPSVFFDAVTNTAFLVTKRKRRRTSQPISFPDAHTALAWCMAQRARFIYLPAPELLGN